MALLLSDILCRFIRPKDWSKAHKRPTPQAFKQIGLSVWHKGLLDKRSVPLEDLLIGSLEGAGQAHHTVQDYYKCAEEVTEKCKDQPPYPSLSVDIRWSPDHVEEPWQQWKDAHFEVDVSGGPQTDASECLKMFRNLLVVKARTKIPPDQYRDL